MTTLDRLERCRQQYAALEPGWSPATLRYQQWVAERLSPGARVLDLGCGRGGIVERLHGAATWIGVDPDAASLREHRIEGLARCRTGGVALPFAGESFDYVVSSWALEHLPDPGGTFREIARVLRHGGRFFFLTPNARHPIPRLSGALGRMVEVQQQLVAGFYGRAAADTFPVYYRANTPEMIDRAAVVAGMRLVREELVNDPAYLAWDERSLHWSAWLSAALPPLWKVHLIGEYVRV